MKSVFLNEGVWIEINFHGGFFLFTKVLITNKTAWLDDRLVPNSASLFEPVKAEFTDTYKRHSSIRG